MGGSKRRSLSGADAVLLVGGIVGATLACVAPSEARADGPSAEDRALATQLFNEGKSLMADEQIHQACEKFKESHRLDPSGGTILNLALCHEKEGLIASAWTEFAEAKSLANRDGRADRAKAADEHIRSLEPRLSTLTVAVPDDARIPGLTILRDETPLGPVTWSTPMAIDGGDHAIVVSAPGKASVTLHVHMKDEGDARSLTVPRLADAPPEAPVRQAPRVDRVLGFVVGGLSIVELGVAIGAAVRAADLDAGSEAACPEGRCNHTAPALAEDAGRWADASTVLTVIGVSSLALGGGLVIGSFAGGGVVKASATGTGVRIGGTF